MRKIVVMLLLTFAMLSLVACGGDMKQSFEQGMKDAMNDTSQADGKTEAESQEPEEPAEQEPENAADQESQEAAETGNPLLDAEVSVYDVMNGTKTEKLGEWAEIQVSKAILANVTQEQFSEFCNTRVKDSGYNWYSINCGDGTGIQFAGSISSVATYGTIDNESCIIESSGTIMVQEDGTYSYTESE